MEIFTWSITEALERSHASLANLSVDVQLNVIYMALYVALIAIKPTAARAKASAAVFLCVGISYSPLFEIMTEVQYYFMLSMIYVATARSITNKKASASCCIMAVFEIIMAFDSWRTDGVEAWLYVNYEMVTTCIHCLVVSSFVRWDFAQWWRDVGRFADSMRSLLRDTGRNAFM